MYRRLSNIDRIKLQFKLNQQVKDLLSKGEIDIDNPTHFEVIVGILSKEQKQRNQNELNLLSQAFYSIKYFTEMQKTTSQEEMLNLYRELQYINVPARRTLFRFGAIGKNFYIILRGSVWVLVGKSGLGDDKIEVIEKKGDKKYDKKKKVEKEYDEGEETDEDEFQDLEDERMLELKYPHMMKVGKIEQGGSFGEIALTNCMPRQATIVCAEDCQFIKLSREAFHTFLSEYYIRIQNKNFEFLKSINIFTDWNDADISVIQYHFQSIDYAMNNVIFREGESIKGVYFIVSGLVELQQKGRDLENAQLSKQQNKQQIVINRYSKGQLFGFMEIMNKQSQRETKAICLTEKVQTLFLQEDRFKLYCCRGESLKTLQLMMKKLEYIIHKAYQIYGENKRQSKQSLSLNLADNDVLLQRMKTENQPFCKTNRSRIVKRPLDLLAGVSHQSSKIQSYYESVSTLLKDSQINLNLNNPLIHIEPSKRLKMQQLQFQLQYCPNPPLTSRIPQFSSGDSKQVLLRQLKLPSIFKQQQEQDDRISIRQLDPVV
ncbi:unnamed protein product (macronuclear) [Paramecium tetraurelia]|uniref:Cyclic nucleotide-binding domain-containing protein n=1 Tax=Paramecium tetraurelia TaxID=5888 RepID=A0DXD6_PARTE|nr:uncharacterized protein GSPATT00021336001 [Paramecium tetraurelia]CAK87703.1 unnamed protein product [Paramecium tetraurelia]|eukprot:XP_001455100.1 hypothetical protein (macronuclear) [Paramecium tetraurelia strain d4-2]